MSTGDYIDEDRASKMKEKNSHTSPKTHEKFYKRYFLAGLMTSIEQSIERDGIPIMLESEKFNNSKNDESKSNLIKNFVAYN